MQFYFEISNLVSSHIGYDVISYFKLMVIYNSKNFLNCKLQNIFSSYLNIPNRLKNLKYREKLKRTWKQKTPINRMLGEN